MVVSWLSVLLIVRSFPTRRSSDLVAVLGVVGSAVAELAVAVLDRSAVWDGLTVTTIVMSGALVTPRLARDRESTRLTSSHRSISYAVICVMTDGSGSETETELATE